MLTAILAIFIISQGHMCFYNVREPVTISGVVDTVEKIEMYGRNEFILIRVVDEDTFDVLLAPSWFIDSLPSAGDSVSIEGSRSTLGREDIIVARKLIDHSQNITLTLRDRYGFPLWRGRMRRMGRSR